MTVDGDINREDGGVSIVGGDEEIAKGDRAGKVELLGDGVCWGNQGSVFSGRGQVVHPGVATLEGRVMGEEVREVKVAVQVMDGELMMFDEW